MSNQATVEEMERVIAEYDGWEVVAKKNDELIFRDTKNRIPHVCNFCLICDFYNEYNWLMPVTKKTYDELNLHSLNVAIHFRDLIKISTVCDRIERCIWGDILQLHIAVYEAILFINNIKKTYQISPLC